MPTSRKLGAWAARRGPLLLLATFAAVLLLPYFNGHWRLADDAYQFALPAWRFQERVLKLGQWPLWNLGEGFGKPTAVNSGSIFYYPPVPLWGLLVGWSESSYLGFLLLHLIVGAGLAWRFARKLELSEQAATFFALAYVGNGYVIGYFSNFPLIFPYLFWPLLGEALWDAYRNRAGYLVTFKTALALTLIETGGYPLTKILIYTATAAVAWPVARKRFKPLLAGSLIAILCAAPEWVMALRGLPLSERMGTDIYDETTYASPTNFLALGTLLMPTAFLKRDSFQLGMVWLERSWWVGALTLALPWAAFRAGSLELRRYRRPIWVALGGMLFAFGGHSFLRELVSALVPVLRYLRFANMARMIPMALLAFLGAAALDTLAKEKAPQALELKKSRKKVSVLWLGFALACVCAALMLGESGLLSRELYFDPSTQWPMGALHTAFYLALAYSTYKLRWPLSSRLDWKWTLVAVLFLSLSDVGYAFRHLIAKEVSPAPQLQAESNFVPAAPQLNQRSLKTWLDGDDWIQWDGNQKVFNAYTVPYHAWMSATYHDPRTAKYAATLVSCHEDAGELGLQSVLPGVHSCRDSSFAIDRYYGNTIEISGSNAAPQWIMVHDFIDEGWHARLNGNEIQIQAAYQVFKAVELRPGQNWKLTFEYRDPWFWPLIGISWVGFMLLAAAAWAPPLRKHLR